MPNALHDERRDNVITTIEETRVEVNDNKNKHNGTDSGNIERKPSETTNPRKEQALKTQ